MKRNITAFVLIWSALFVVWAAANPPNGGAGAGTGKITADGSGNIGIATSTPMALLDVNGTTTIRKSLDMTVNKITNVAMPVAGTDAVPLPYISTQIAATSSSTTRLWGEGRPGSAVGSPGAGQCTHVVNGRTIKISKSSYTATWDKAAAACPANWWVCTASERDYNDAGANFGVCPSSGATISQITRCDGSYAGDPTHYDNWYVPPQNAENNIVWVSDVGSTAYTGSAVSTTGLASNESMCTIAPVWCCSY